MLVLCLTSFGVLSGCASKPPRAFIPPTLLECQDLPERPSLQELDGPRGSNVAAGYVVNLRGTAVDCKGNLAAVKGVLSGEVRRPH